MLGQAWPWQRGPGAGEGGAKHHHAVLCDNIQDVLKTAVRRLACQTLNATPGAGLSAHLQPRLRGDPGVLTVFPKNGIRDAVGCTKQATCKTDCCGRLRAGAPGSHFVWIWWLNSTYQIPKITVPVSHGALPACGPTKSQDLLFHLLPSAMGCYHIRESVHHGCPKASAGRGAESSTMWL